MVSRLAAGWIAVLCCIALIGCARLRAVPIESFVADVPVALADADQINGGLADVPLSLSERAERLREMFRAVGCSNELSDQYDGHSEYPNVICTMPGETSRIIIVGAQFDKPRYGSGIVDNWSGTAMLPALYAALKTRPRTHTYQFIGFTDATRKHRVGSRYFVRKLVEHKGLHFVRAMVNLKGVGLGDAAVWSNRADPDLLLDLSSVGEVMEATLRDVNFRRSEHPLLISHSREFPFIADAESFRRFGVPTITIHSFSADTIRLIRASRHDVDPQLIDPDAYYETYRLVAVYLGYLDQSIDARGAQAAN